MIGLCEFLSTVNKDKFLSLLRKEFTKGINNIECLGDTDNQSLLDEYSTWGKDVIVVQTEAGLTKNDEKHLVEFCRKFNYVCTMKRYDDYLIEPIQSQNQISGKVVYHITTKDIYDEFISKKGLKCRGNQYRNWSKIDNELLNNPAIYNFGNEKHDVTPDSYRSITPRIYVVASRAQKIIYKIANQIGKTGLDGECDGVVLKIDLRKHKNIKLYQDNCNPEKLKAYYTLEDIPPEIISIDDDLTELIHEVIYV